MSSASPPPGGANKLPLEGVRVLEFCHTVMGPSAGVLLADLGCDVIKIEPADGADRTRRMAGFASGFFYAFNRNKRAIGVDLKSAEGRAVVYRLAQTADIVIENYAPATMKKLGCSYEDLSAINPRLIYCSLKGYLSGPYENRAALDEVVQFQAGLAYMTGPPGKPLRAGASVVDIMGGMFAVIGIQAALRERETTGRGQFVKSALFESCAFLMVPHLAGEAMTGQETPPFPARRGAWAVYEPFTCKDGEQIFLGITSDGQWKRFCARFGRQDLIDDPELETNELRTKKRDLILPVVAGIVAGYDLAEMSSLAEEVDISFAPVARPKHLRDDPHLNQGGHMVEIEFPNGTSSRMPGLPLEMGEHTFGVRRQAPKPAQHTRDVLLEAGYAPGDIDLLVATGAIVCGDA
jgi:crotonobetainyl-CoA:carnitine CoA-transferase CaiB-like acyl-CoA transferase